MTLNQVVVALLICVALMVIPALVDIWWNFRRMTRRRGAELPSARVVSSLRKSGWRAP